MPDDPSWSRRYSLPFEGGIEGDAQISPYAELDRTVIMAPRGEVIIGASRLVQCVVVEPATIGGNVRATAAIIGMFPGSAEGFKTTVGRGCVIEAHADIQGHVGRDVIVRRGAQVHHEATVGDGVELMDRCLIGVGAHIGDGAIIGVGATVGDHASVHSGARVPAGANIPPEGYWKSPTERLSSQDTVSLQLVDPEDEEPDSMWADDEEDDWGTNAMVKGRPVLQMSDFNPGTGRSWVLSKLARVAVRGGNDNQIRKADVRRDRPELVDHPVVKEVLRMQPPPTAVELNEMSWEALSEAYYDVYTGIRFNAGDNPGWQMLTQEDNDVFVLAVPQERIQKLVDAVNEEFHGPGHNMRITAQDVRAWLFPKVEWHPDRDIMFPVGWIRTLLYPRTTMVVVEVQTDRPWLKFDWGKRRLEDDRAHDDDWRSDEQLRAELAKGPLITAVGEALREEYASFASDAINIVVEWAFGNRYHEVLVLDRKSRKKLGGRPPKDYYETFPKQYTVSGPQPLPPWIELSYWLERESLNARRIRPNPSCS